MIAKEDIKSYMLNLATHNCASDYVQFCRKICHLTREFRVKLHAKTDIAQSRSDE